MKVSESHDNAADMMNHRSRYVDCDVGVGNLIDRMAPDLPNGFDLKAESVHIAFREVPTAGIERHLAVGCDEIVDLEELVAVVRVAKTVLHHRHHYADRKILITLNYVDVLRLHP